jgi:SWI/SNF-related matrix-associated actin-dependent regulator of chromatin subfamily A3
LAVSHRGRSANSTALESLLRLRLFCNNGIPDKDGSAIATVTDEILSYLQQVEQAVCVYCTRAIYSINDDPDTDGGFLMPQCYHLVCRECYPRYHAEKRRCGQCLSRNMDISITESVKAIRQGGSCQSEVAPRTMYPSKLTALMGELQLQLSHKR